MFKNKSFRKATLTFQNVRHCAFCKAKKMTWYGMIIKWLHLKKILLSFFLRVLFCSSILLLMTVKDQQTKKTFRFHMATGDFTTIPCSLIMSLNCIIEENRKRTIQIQKCFLQCDVPASAIQSTVQIQVIHFTKIFLREWERRLICSTSYACIV